MTNSANPFFGDARVQVLQKARDEQVAELNDIPGAVVHARTFSSDNPDALGWDRLRKVMAEEGIVTLRGVGEHTINVAQTELAQFEPVLHFWDLFMADADRLREVCGALASDRLPDGIIPVSHSDLTHETAREAQVFLDAQGVSPFSTTALLGKLFPARLLVLKQSDNRIAGVGFAAMTHNKYSVFHKVAWVGLIAVAPELRGIGLGKRIDAICNLLAVDELDARATMEFVARDNVPSRAMLESCGLRQVPGKSVVMFSTSSDRLTR